MTNILESVIGAIRKVTSPHQTTDTITPDLHLFDAKVIDSFGVITLVSELEAVFHISIATEDLIIQYFDTPATIASLIESYLAKKEA